MKSVEVASPPEAAVAVRALPGILLDYLTLTKPRVNVLVVFTTFVGLYVAAPGAGLWLLVHTLVGTALVASGAAAFNQVLERDVDAKMRRTRTRPLPDGRLGETQAVWFAAVLSGLGLAQLALGANVLAASVALATIASYALIYTPMKRVTSLSTVIGAVPGALPPVIGWAAGRGQLSVEAWILFAIVFLWQMPHVLAVSWLYRDDYALGGFRLLPVLEPDGGSTARQTVSYSAALVPASLFPVVVGMAGPLYAAGGLAAGIVMVGASVSFARSRTAQNARRLFLTSVAYLPVLWVLLLIDRV